MSLKDIQNETDEWVRGFTTSYWTPHEIAVRLAEETGEVAREVNHLYGPKKKKLEEPDNNLGNELADVLFTVVCMANREGIDLQKAWDEMMSKKHYGRDADRFEKRRD
ncbi:nucleotide pyrophosphohydrolase [Candidatus Pacearchaeota archaeon]|nr:nucleotide pyrophosphohydrolase [Candidatus Pacearchaeota archaeon]